MAATPWSACEGLLDWTYDRAHYLYLRKRDSVETFRATTFQSINHPHR